jgi:hypothetical protein
MRGFRSCLQCVCSAGSAMAWDNCRVAPGRVALNVFFPPTDPHHPAYAATQKYPLNRSAPAFPYLDGIVMPFGIGSHPGGVFPVMCRPGQLTVPQKTLEIADSGRGLRAAP